MRRAAATAALIVLLSASATASAQPQPQQPPTDVAGAEALFEEARSLMETNGSSNDRTKLALACAKFAESQRLAPAAGTLLNLGTCLEKIGKTASAWGAFREAIAMSVSSGQKEREEYARELAQTIAPRLVRLVVNVSPNVSAAAKGRLEVRRDGILITSAQWGTPIPVDPGAHVIEATAPDKRPFQATIEAVKEGSQVSVDVAALEDAPRAPDLLATNLGVAGDKKSDGDGGNKSTLKIAALASAGVGVVLVGVGTYFGLRAASKSSELEDQAQGRATAWGPDQAAAYDAGESAATLANVFLVSGAIALVAGGALAYFGFFNSSNPSSSKNSALRWQF